MPNMPTAHNSRQIAFGGMIAALCIALMFLSGVLPFMEITTPAVAGVLLIFIVLEIGFKWSLIVYAVTALLALLITPNREAAVLFIAFFGYYPIIKSKLEQIKNRLIEYIIKFCIFDVAILGSYMAMIFLFQMTELLDGMSDYGTVGLLGLLVLANVTFYLYDLAITRLVSMYIHWFRPKYLKKMK
ncbi:MAG TPA: hypothetical protein H9671_10515 [Firmicutes bacterium]|nr:hypothetical protein [Bacillota bacterium]